MSEAHNGVPQPHQLKLGSTPMNLLAAATMLLGLSAAPLMGDKWDNIDNGTMCRMQTGSPATGVIALTFVPGENLALQLFKDKFVFRSMRMANLRDAPWITRIKARFTGYNGRAHEQGIETGPAKPWDWWINSWARSEFDIVLGQGALEMGVRYKFADQFLRGVDNAEQLSVEFADGSPTWSASTPDQATYDSWSQCVARHGGIRPTSIDRFADERDAERD
jgi:hypothetical protein